MSRVIIIAAVGADGAIGRRGDLAFHISADLKRFKSLTMGSPLIMGRKTFESFPNGPLPGRRNIVVTRNAGYGADGIEIATSVDEALRVAADAEKVFVIGGGEIYAQTIDMADELALTDIKARLDDADTFFPSIDPAEWELVDASPWHVDEKTGLTYGFITLERSQGKDCDC